MSTSSRMTIPDGVEITALVTPAFAEILTPEALTFLARLQRTFGARREELLQKRQERQQALDVRGAHRSPVGAAQERREDLLRAPVLLVCRLRLRDEYTATARRVARPPGLERAGDRHLINGRRQPRVAVHVEVRVVRLPQRFHQ